MKQSIKHSIAGLSFLFFVAGAQFTYAQESAPPVDSQAEEIRKGRHHKMAKRLTKDQVQTYKDRIDNIKNDSTLSKEAKKANFKEIKSELKSTKGIDRELTREGRKAIRKARKEERAVQRDLRKATKLERKNERAEGNIGKRRGPNDQLGIEMQIIKKDSSLSEEEKKARIAELRQNYHQKSRHDDSARKEDDKIQNGKAFEKASIDPEKAAKALKQLDKTESKYNKLLEKGKISQDVYDTYMSKLNELKQQLES